MEFTILLTVYKKDNPGYLSEALDSILNQTLLPNEVVIVEDGPITDSLQKVIDAFLAKFANPIHILALPKNIGTGLAINEGLKKCTFELVAKMDSDDINYPDRFEKQINIYKSHPEISFLSAFVSEFENDDIRNIISLRKLPERHEAITFYAKKRCPLNQPVAMYRKSAIEDCGYYRKFTFGEDYDLWVRALLKGYKFYNIQEPLLYFRTSDETIRKRGSFWYLKIDLSHHYDFYKEGFLTFPQFLYNSSIRIVVRLFPLRVRKLFYSKFLRTKSK